MVVDTSVIVAILLKESDREVLMRKLARASSRELSAVGYLEAGMVLTSHFGGAAASALDRFLLRSSILTVPVTPVQAKLALAAFQQFGKGRHPAALNFGDCFSYALAKSSAEPLLFKGNDFAKTDIAVG
jgi:ribonuclease VapC